MGEPTVLDALEAVGRLREEVERLNRMVDKLSALAGVEARDLGPPTIGAQLDAYREDRRRRRERPAPSL